MKTLVVILICIGLVGLEFLGVAVLVAPRAVWRGVCRVAVAVRERAKWAAGEAREALEQLFRHRGPGLGQGRLA